MGSIVLDKELLELAAKAAGVEIQWESDGTIQNRMNRPTIPYFCQNMSSAIDWNPLADDGDALRLAVKLDLDIAFKDPHGKSVSIYSEKGWMQQLYDNDEEKPIATRRAIVRAAAEIGRSM